MWNYIQRGINSIRQIKDIRIATAIFSLMTTFLAVAAKNPLNNDGILYLQTAEVFANAGWEAAFDLYPWPFYSFIIASLAKLTHLSYEHAAYLVNAILIAVIVISFLTLLMEYGASRTTQIFGAIIILGHPRLHHYQNYIIRGFGYWAFCLLSLLHLIRYYRHLKWSNALIWGICSCVATLFRIEGAVICAFAPLVMLVRSNAGLWRRFSQTIKPYGLHIIILSILVFWWFTDPNRIIVHDSRLDELVNQLQNGLFLLGDSLTEKAALISQIIFNSSATKWGLTMTISGLIGVCLYRLITTIGTLHILLCGHSVYKNLIQIQDGSKTVLIYFTLLSILIPIIEIGQTFIISHRFFMLGSLLLLLWAPFSLDRIFQNFRENKTVFSANFLLYALLLLTLITMLTVAIIPIKTSRAYIISAGTWLKSNMPSHARLYSNTRQIPYYAQRNFIEWEVSDNRPKPRWKSNDVIALRLSRKHYKRVSKDLENLDIQVIKVFSNKSGDKAIVFKVP